MATSRENYNPNETSLYFAKASKLLLLGDLPGCVKWIESDYTKPIYRHIQSCITVCILIFVGMEVGALVTQKNLSEKQAADLLVMSFSQPIVLSYQFIISYHKERVKDLLYTLCISLKNVYNDPDLERAMIKRATLFLIALLLNMLIALISFGYEGVSQAIRTDGTFVAVITAWPDVNEKSTSASVGRIIGYLMFWIITARAAAVFLLLIITTGCLSYQYKNLQSYFYSLNGIFKVYEDDGIVRENVEESYEDALKVGIKLHVETLWCTRQCQVAFSIVYSGQITLNVAVFSVYMLQMMNSEHTSAIILKIVFSTAALLSSTAVLMCNAGNVTVEAELLPTAMYSSGWQNCRGTRSLRVRKLLVVAMTLAQKHVVIRSFGVMEISYRAFISMVKASYSAFSILY